MATLASGRRGESPHLFTGNPFDPYAIAVANTSPFPALDGLSDPTGTGKGIPTPGTLSSLPSTISTP